MMQRMPVLFVLLVLWSNSLIVTSVTPDELHTITKCINDAKTKLITAQHAYVVRFEEQCSSLNCETIKNALNNEDSTKIKNTVISNKIYEGENMVIAKVRRLQGSAAEHAEYRLLYPASGSNLSPVQKLLNKSPKAGCVVFYTLNSPCVGYCAKPGGTYNILEKLNVFKGISDKALVFQKFYNEDINVGDKWKNVDNKINLYRCNNNGCIKCFDNNGKLNNDCVK